MCDKIDSLIHLRPLRAKLYNSATSSRVCPDSIAATARSRRSSEYGFAVHDWPPCPSRNLESDSCLLGNPSRFDLPGKCARGGGWWADHLNPTASGDCWCGVRDCSCRATRNSLNIFTKL